MKVLLISHNPITTYQNMGKTYLTMFSSFSKEEICQLYIYPTIPDIDICSSYFRITDSDILSSYFHFGKVNSKIIEKESIDTKKHSLYENEKEANIYKKNNKNSFTLMLRDLMWTFSKWYNQNLEKWLDDQNPTCIFLAPGESKFIYDVALRIAKKRNIPINMYICDEYYFVKTPKHVIDKVQLTFLKRKIEKTIRKTTNLFTICDELAVIYKERFGVNTHTLYTGAYCRAINNTNLRNSILGISYMGNLSNKRYESISEIGYALDNINSTHGTDYKLFLYVKSVSQTARYFLKNIKSIKYCGFVTGDDYQKVLLNADVLLHVESFDSDCIEKVKHSISTKIADSLYSGIPLMAYGPTNIASINYLVKTNSAFLCSKRENLENTIIELLDVESRRQKALNALQVAQLNHDAITNSNTLYKILIKE